MTLPRCSYLILAMLLWAASDVVWSAKVELGTIPVRSMSSDRAASKPLATTLPKQAHVLIFLDASNAKSLSLLSALRRDGYPGYRTTLVLLGDDARASVGTIGLSDWDQSSNVRANRNDAKQALGASRFPVVVGLSANGEEAWRRYPKSNRQLGALVVRMLEWLQ